MRRPIGQQCRGNQHPLIQPPGHDPARAHGLKDISTNLGLGHRCFTNVSHQSQVRHEGPPEQARKPRRFQNQRKVSRQVTQTVGNRLAAEPNQLFLRPAGQCVEMQQTSSAHPRFTRNQAARRIDDTQLLIGYFTQETEGHMQCFRAGHPPAKPSGNRHRQLLQRICNGRRRSQGHKQSHVASLCSTIKREYKPRHAHGKVTRPSDICIPRQGIQCSTAIRVKKTRSTQLRVESPIIAMGQGGPYIDQRGNAEATNLF